MQQPTSTILFGIVLALGLLRGAANAQRLAPRLAGTGESHSVLLAADGTLFSWGMWGETNRAVHSNDTVFTSALPVPMPGGGTWRQVAAGCDYTLAIRQDGTLWAWGDNVAGQLGDGTRISRYRAVQVGHATNWQRISANYNLSLGVRADGTLWAWGTNQEGQLGLDTLTRSYMPRQVGTATNWVEAVAGFSHCVALRADGTLWAWGDNDASQFAADSTITYQRTPRRVGSGTRWVAVAAGWYHTAALRADGTLWTWRNNFHGPLGNGTRRGSRVPQQVGRATTWRQVSAGGQHTMAVQADGSLWAWGMNEENWLGFDWAYPRPASLLRAVQVSDQAVQFVVRPLPVDSCHTWLAVECTADHAVGVRTNGSVWAWGYNQSGQVGPHTASYPSYPGPMRVLHEVPVQVPGLRAQLPLLAPQSGRCQKPAGR